jgi:hypothetical protein
MSSSSIHVATNNRILFFLGWIISHHIFHAVFSLRIHPFMGTIHAVTNKGVPIVSRICSFYFLTHMGFSSPAHSEQAAHLLPGTEGWRLKVPNSFVGKLEGRQKCLAVFIGQRVWVGSPAALWDCDSVS